MAESNSNTSLLPFFLRKSWKRAQAGIWVWNSNRQVALAFRTPSRHIGMGNVFLPSDWLLEIKFAYDVCLAFILLRVFPVLQNLGHILAGASKTGYSSFQSWLSWSYLKLVHAANSWHGKTPQPLSPSPHDHIRNNSEFDFSVMPLGSGMHVNHVTLNDLREEEKRKIHSRVESWKKAWCNRDAEAYGKNLHKEFHDSQGRKRIAFLLKERNHFAGKGRIQADVTILEMTRIGKGLAQVRLKVEYAGDAEMRQENPNVAKILILRESGLDWLIIKE